MTTIEIGRSMIVRTAAAAIPPAPSVVHWLAQVRTQ